MSILALTFGIGFFVWCCYFVDMKLAKYNDYIENLKSTNQDDVQLDKDNHVKKISKRIALYDKLFWSLAMIYVLVFICYSFIGVLLLEYIVINTRKLRNKKTKKSVYPIIYIMYLTAVKISNLRKEIKSTKNEPLFEFFDKDNSKDIDLEKATTTNNTIVQVDVIEQLATFVNIANIYNEKVISKNYSQFETEQINPSIFDKVQNILLYFNEQEGKVHEAVTTVLSDENILLLEHIENNLIATVVKAKENTELSTVSIARLVAMFHSYEKIVNDLSIAIAIHENEIATDWLTE